MKSLIMPLRSLGNKNQQYPILIFDKEDHILSEVWKDIQFFPEVYYMQGNPIKSKDLFRAGIKRAKAVIILSRNNNHDDNNHEVRINEYFFTCHDFFLSNIMCLCPAPTTEFHPATAF